VRLRVDLAPVDRARWLVGVVRGIDRMPEPELAAGGQRYYEVDTSSDDFGRLRSFSEGVANPDASGRRCYEVFHGRTLPCVGCPLTALPEVPWPRLGVAPPSNPTGAFTVVIAEPRAHNVVRLRLHTVNDSVLATLIHAKIATLAKRAQLSPREQEVLQLVLLGRTMEEIAVVLEISPRTARFHQASVLEKLGAESRFDLFRLIL
jgi:DNA-binding CsgD family transcriptional regulator